MLIASILLASTVVLVPPSYKLERIGLYISAAADVITTRIAIINGAKEGNPLLTPLIGEKPSTLKLVGVKLISIGLTELTAKYLRSKNKSAKYLYKISIYSWSYAAGLNLRFVWK